MSQFHETLDLLKSASAWDKFTLARFGVHFQRTEETELSDLIGPTQWYENAGDDEPATEFMDSTIPCMKPLT